MTSVFLAICLEDPLQIEEIPRLALSVCLNSHISDQIVSQLKRKWNWFHINIKPFWISSFDLYLNSVSAYNRNRSGTEQRAHDFSSCSIKLAFSASKLLLERFNSSFSLFKRVFALVCPVAKISRFWIDFNFKRWQWCWWHCYVGDFMVVTVLRCWWQNHKLWFINYVGDFFRCVGDFISNIRHQHHCNHFKLVIIIMMLIR